MQPDQNQPNPPPQAAPSTPPAQMPQPAPVQPPQPRAPPASPVPAPSSAKAQPKKIALIVLGVILVIFGLQGIYAEITNSTLGLFTLFNLAVTALGFVLIYNQLAHKKLSS